MKDDEIYCGDDTGGVICGKGPLGMKGQGPAYAYGPTSKYFYAKVAHYKCEKHHDKACRLSPLIDD